MRHIIDAGTDAATICLVDPAALPDDFDAKVQRETFAYLKQLSSDGLLHQIETGTDGSFLLHLFVDELPPNDLRSDCKDPYPIVLPVPSGTLWFIGAEALLGGRAELGASNLGKSAQIPPGSYSGTLFRTEFSDYPAEKMLPQAVGRLAAGLFLYFGLVVAAVVLSAVCCLASFFFLPQALKFVLPTFGATLLASVMLYRSSIFQMTQKTFRKFELEHCPTIIMELHRGAV